MQRKVVFITLILFFFFNGIGLADTTVSGTINGGVWDTAGSPYLVEGNISVNNLTIQPGVRVEFLGPYEFKVTGTLIADGSGGTSILFRNNSASTGDWLGMVLDYAGSGTKLKNCVITGAAGTGLQIINCYPEMNNCSITGNTANTPGGGLNILLDAINGDLVLKDCNINNNTAYAFGGGIYAAVSVGRVRFINCTINGNNTPAQQEKNFHGGGIYIASAADRMDFINCRISDNFSNSLSWHGYSGRAENFGGGMYISNGNVYLHNSIVNSNKANCRAVYTYPAYGGGIYIDNGSLEMINCIISNNSCEGQVKGGGIYSENGTVNLLNCTVANNDPSGMENKDGVASVLNSIVYFNTVNQIVGNATVNYSDIEGGWSDPEATGNIDSNPIFIGTTDLIIGADSPCVDAGNPETKYNDAGRPPALGTARNDMGAHGGPGNTDDAYYPCQNFRECTQADIDSFIITHGLVCPSSGYAYEGVDAGGAPICGSVRVLYTQTEYDNAFGGDVITEEQCEQMMIDRDLVWPDGRAFAGIDDQDNPIYGDKRLHTPAEIQQAVTSILQWGDTNGDGKIGLEEAIRALLISAGVEIVE